MTVSLPSCFKAYDIRGKVPEELNVNLSRQIGRAFAAVFGLKKVVVGRDIRLSSDAISGALIEGLLESGCEVVDLGVCGAEEMYFAAFAGEGEGVDGGVIVTASHNPAEYNGMKFVTRGARPVSGESGLELMAQMIVEDRLPPPAPVKGQWTVHDDKAGYIAHLLQYIEASSLKPLKIVVNSGNGCAGAIVDLLAPNLPYEFIRLNHQPDGTFPKGVPNPLLPDRREETAQAVRDHGADLGLAWDGDFDRCFFWDEEGNFIEGYYIVGLLATEMLRAAPGAKILYDPRLTWNTEELAQKAGGIPVMTRTGHAYIKERMRQEDALYGGEMSAHHYFRRFGYCDSGMIPWLLICGLLCREKVQLSSLVKDRMAAYPVSGEINSTVADAEQVLAMVRSKYGDGKFDTTDGLSVEYEAYRFNIRESNTEPLLRLNVESRGDAALMARKTNELLALIRK